MVSDECSATNAAGVRTRRPNEEGGSLSHSRVEQVAHVFGPLVARAGVVAVAACLAEAARGEAQRLHSFCDASSGFRDALLSAVAPQLIVSDTLLTGGRERRRGHVGTRCEEREEQLSSIP